MKCTSQNHTYSFSSGCHPCKTDPIVVVPLTEKQAAYQLRSSWSMIEIVGFVQCLIIWICDSLRV
jgi:hypothetical protein